MKKHRILPLLLALILCMSSAVPAAAETASGSVVQLTKTEGTVTVAKSSGKSVSLRSNLRLYKGYRVNTSEKSYAWINLDDAKLIKEDASSEVEVRKSGKKLEVNVSAGSVFFDVSEKLDDDESLNISTSTMVVGIRGTSGWVEIENRWQSKLYVLEGTTRCFVSDPVTGQTKSAEVRGGEMVECVVYPQDRAGDKCDILTKKYEISDIPGYVLVDLVQDVPLCDKILKETGMDIPRTLAKQGGGRPDGRTGNTATREVIREAEKRLHQDEKQTGIKLDDINEKLENQDNHVSTDAVWEDDKPTPPDPNKGTGGGSDRPTTPDRPTPPVTKTYTVTFSLDGEGAAWPDGTTGPITLSTGANGRLTTTPPTPVRAGHEFGGWYVASRARAGETPIDLNTYVFSSDTRLRAIWTQKEIPPETFTVTFNANGGTVSPATAQTAADGTAVLPTPTREGFTFDGWFTAATGGTAVTAATKFTQNTTIYAHWTEVPTSGVQWEYIEATKTLRIWGNGAMESYATRSQPWNAYVPEIETGTIENGVTNIGTNTFEYCDKLTSVSIPNSVTSIANRAFQGCTSLGAVTIPNSVTSIGPAAFSNCDSLANVSIPNSVTSIGQYAFYYCSSLTSVTIPNGVTSIEEAVFCYCHGLTRVDIPSSVTSIETRAFYNCTSLTDIYFGGTRAQWNAVTKGDEAIPNGVTVHCTDDGGTPTGGARWEYLPATKTLRIFGTGPMEDIEGYTSGIPWAAHNPDITTVTIEDGVTSIGDSAFYGCNNLTSVTIPNSVTSIGRDAFVYCSSLASVDIPNSVTSIGSGVFQICDELTSINVDPENPNYSSIDGVLFDKNQTDIIRCPEGKSGSYTVPSSVTSIGVSAFQNCHGLTSVTIPNSVTNIELLAFTYCHGLISVTIPGSVTSINGSAFDVCDKLTSISVDPANLNYRSVDGVVFNKNQTQLVIYPSGRSGAYTIPNSVTSIGRYAFSGCQRLTSVDIPNSVTSIEGWAFSDCRNLTSVTIPDSVTSIKDCTFQSCTSLTSVTIPASVTSIGSSAFERCSSLTSVTIPNSVTSIGTYAFDRCTGLTSVTIGNSVTSIGRHAFDNCNSLTDVYYSGTQAEWNAITIDSTGNEDLTGATIHCTDGDITPTP